MFKKRINFTKIIFLVLFFIFLFILIKFILVKKDPKEHLLYVVPIFNNKHAISEFSKELKNESNKNNSDIKLLMEKYLDVFKLYTNNQEQNIQIQELEKNNNVFNNIQIKLNNDSKTIEIIYVPNQTKNIIRLDTNYGFNYLYFNLEEDNSVQKNKKQQKQKLDNVKDFFTVLIGTNYKYIVDEKYKKYFDINDNKDCFLKFSNISSNNNEEYKIKKLLNNTKTEINQQDLTAYNEIIKQVTVENNNPPHLISEINNDIQFPIFVYNSGYLPIQWPSKLNWSGLLGFYYVWNALIISIGFFLYIFSHLFGNLGFGIILTTILIRTLSWPIYTKTSTFSLNMSLVQPEIDKIRNKYILKKDPVSIQKMQLETLKVYKKYNVGFLGMFTTFLQLPIFMSMLTTLNRFRIPGGIFNLDNQFLDKKPFLGFIKLSTSTTNDIFIGDILIKILLSTFVGVTMIILNKISFKKPFYLQNKTYNVLSTEEKDKKEQTEKSFKIVSYFMVAIMVFAAFNDNVLSLYWLVGNTYTIFQTIFNRKQMEKKYYLLKQKNYE
ncbi:YidC/Oxa1 family membrane protein insertase [Candidatus Phytoplasma pyri]|uniref:YidC/Oxa1 family membrane protein insertase n=1 Tax=Candidatus Phytoplasma pyri TaxID=47566 RepID=UPI00398333D1